MSQVSTDGLVTIPAFGRGWEIEEQISRAPAPSGTLLKCRRVPREDYFLFMLAKQYEVAPEQALPADVLTNRVFKGIYEKTFEYVHIGSTEWIEADGLRWYQATIELKHASLGQLAKIERVAVLGPKVFLLSAEGKQPNMRGHHSFVQRWLADCRFAQLTPAAAAADTAATEAAAVAVAAATAAAKEALPGEVEDLHAKSNQLYGAGRYVEARAVASEAQGRARSALGDTHRLTIIGFALLGELDRVMGDVLQARTMLEHAVKLGTAALDAMDPDLTSAIINLGRVRLDEEDLPRAEAHFVDALARARGRGPATHGAAVALSSLGYVKMLRGNFPEAEALLLEALTKLSPPAAPPDDREGLRALHNLARVMAQSGRVAEAEPLLVRALERRRAALGPEHPDIIESLTGLGALYFATKQPARAEPLYRAATGLTRRVHGNDHRFVADRLVDLAMNAKELGDASPAVPALTEALAIRQKRLGRPHPSTVWIAQTLTALRRALGLPDVPLNDLGLVSLALLPDHLIAYHSGSDAPTDPYGAITLTLHGDGRARMCNTRRGAKREWQGRVESATLQRLLDALKAAGFPNVRDHRIPAGSALRVLTIQAAGRESESLIAWHATAEVGYGHAFAMLDSIIVQMSGGAVTVAPDCVPGLVMDAVAVALSGAGAV